MSGLYNAQSRLLELFESSDILILDRKRFSYKVTMQELSALTALTSSVYSLFEWPKFWVITQGTDIFCLVASSDDYTILQQFYQKNGSSIYSAAGQGYRYGKAHTVSGRVFK